MKNIMPSLYFLSLSLLLLPGCTNTSAFSNQNANDPTVTSNEHLVMSTLYQQSAAEYRALCYQAFNIAKNQVDQAAKYMGMKKPAVIVDIDETMLDNTPYQAYCVLENISYPKGWEKWINTKSAGAVPGALEFTKYAEKNGVEVFYITNRKALFRQQTIQNLKNLGFPFADIDHLLMRTSTSSKTERRRSVSEKFMIITLIGDNLNDFSGDFEKATVSERFAITDEKSKEFGTAFIVLPNAMYGDWEGAVYNYMYDKSPMEKFEIRHATLKAF